MTIAGFKITKNHIITLAIVAGVIGLIGFKNSLERKASEEDAKQKAKEAAEEYQRTHQQGTEFSYDYDAVLQKNLVKKYGDPPEGFK